MFSNDKYVPICITIDLQSYFFKYDLEISISNCKSFFNLKKTLSSKRRKNSFD